MPVSRRRARLLLALILSAGAILRLHGLAWDANHHLHPDERFISMVEEKLAFPGSVSQYFDSARSPLNPYNRDFGSFVYGTLPIVLAKAAGRVLHKTGYDGTFLVGRVLSTLFDLLTVLLVYRIARRFAGRPTSLLAAALLSFCAFSIQLSHFWTVDTFLTTFTALVLLGSARIAQGRAGWIEVAGTGLCLGLAASCKITALALLLPVGVAILVRAVPGLKAGRSRGKWLLAAALRLAVVLAATALTVRVAFPTAFAGPSPFSFRLDPRWIKDLKSLASLTNSVAGFPPSLQWAGRTLLFPIRNFVLQGAGVLFGIAAIASLFWALATSWTAKRLALLPIALHTLFVFLYHGLSLVKTMRYFYPAYPAMAVLAALGTSALARRAAVRPGWAWLRFTPHAVLAGTIVWALAFSTIYARPHTRVEASRWIYEEVPPRSRIANESWDDGLPFPMPGHDNLLYSGPMLELWGPDNREKVGQIVKTLGDADWIAVTSGRVYRNITRLPSVYPMTTAYYRALFDGRLGFDLAADFTSYPSLGPLRISDDSAEEQFTVYDHPRVLLFRKAPGYSPARVQSLLLAALDGTPPTIWDWEKQPRSKRRVARPVEPPRGQAAARSARAPADAQAGSLPAAVLWYVALAVVGAAAFPLCAIFFTRLADRGFGLSRVVGLVLATYALNFGIARGGFQNGRRAAIAALVLLVLAGGAAFFFRRRAIRAFVKEHRRALWQSEAVFAAGFVFFLLLRALNPEITWGEKPMDFSILNILVRTRSLPPSDPWFAGAPLGYYTFGQEIIAFLTLLTGLSTRYTFNLAFGLLGGALLQGAFSLARNWSGTLRGGLAGAAFVGLFGNLAGLREWLTVRRPQHQPLDWHYFWATSRVIKDTINEYPLWSLIFADLHAHVLAMPLLLLFLAQALQLVRVHADRAALPRTRLLAAALLGFFGAAEALTNAWDSPLLAGLLVLTILAAAVGGAAAPLTAAARALLAFAVAAGVAVCAAMPLWPPGGGLPAWGRNLDYAAGMDVATVFGLFFFLAIAWWFAAAADRWNWTRGRRTALALAGIAVLGALAWRSADLFCLAGIILFAIAFFALAEKAEDRLAFGLVGTAFFLILFTQRLFIYDRMNTFFKLYLECWLLLAVACAVLVFRPSPERGALPRWPAALRVGFALLAVCALFTTVTAARGALTDARPTKKRDAGGPTLDGLRYLEKASPGDYRAVVWLRRNIRGTPVILEAQGPSYQDFGRISMLTGLPTVLGWEYHVQQRGNPVAQIALRKAAVEAIYTNRSADAVEELLRRYHVGYVYVGPLERKTYPAAGLAKFQTAKDLFSLAYENPEVRIYRVEGADAEDVIAPKHETLPEPEAAAPSAESVEPEEQPIISDTPAPGRPPFFDLKEPRDAAVDGQGRIWIADFGHSRLRIFDADGGYLGGWGGKGDGSYQLREPCGVAIRGDDLLIADTWNGRVLSFTLAGAWKAAVRELYGPRGVAAAADGSIWVTDTGNNRIVAYDASLSAPRLVGRKGTAPGEFDGPVGIATGPDGAIYVCDVGNRRLQLFGPEGAFRRAIPIAGWKPSDEPHLEIEDDGTIDVTDPSGGALLELAPDGRLVRRRDTDDAGKPFSNPTGVAIDRKNRILYVINSGTSSVAKLKLSERKGR